MSAPLLEIDGLTFRYRRATEPALRDLSLTVDPGEVLSWSRDHRDAARAPSSGPSTGSSPMRTGVR